MGDTKKTLEERFKDATREDLIKCIIDTEAEAGRLYSETEKLKEVLGELSNVQFLKRLEFLFKIVENSRMFEGRDSLIKAVNEIEEVMFPKKKDEK